MGMEVGGRESDGLGAEGGGWLFSEHLKKKK